MFSSPIRHQIIESIPCLFRRIICQLKPPGDTVLGLHTEPLPASIQIPEIDSVICVDGKAFAAYIRIPVSFQILIESVQGRLLRQIIAVCGDLRQPSVTSDAVYDPQILSLQILLLPNLSPQIPSPQSLLPQNVPP